MENASWYSCCAVTLPVCLWRGEGGKSNQSEEKIVQGQVLPCLPHLISSTQCMSHVTEMRLQWINSWNVSGKVFSFLLILLVLPWLSAFVEFVCSSVRSN